MLGGNTRGRERFSRQYTLERNQRLTHQETIKQRFEQKTGNKHR